MSTTTFPKAKIFLSYASQDEGYKNKLLTHLKNLERQDYLETWNASQLLGGQKWDAERQAQLMEADIVLLLISSDAIADNYIHDKEIQKALQNAQNGKTIVVPILIRPVDYQGLGVEKYLVLPSNGKAISEWNNSDKAYQHIAHQIRKIIEHREQLYAEDRPEKVLMEVNEKDPPPQDDLKTKLWQYLTAMGVVIALLAGITEISGYSLRDFFDSNTTSNLTEPFDVTVFVHGEAGKQDMILRQKGEVIMDFSGDRRSEPIDQDGKVTFKNIPVAKAKDSVLLNIDFSEPYRPTIPYQKYALIPYTDIYLEVALKDLDKVFGTVLYKDAPLKGVDVSIGKLQTTTDQRGYYELDIPKDLQRQKQSVQFYKDGYKLQTKTAFPQTQEELRVIMEQTK